MRKNSLGEFFDFGNDEDHLEHPQKLELDAGASGDGVDFLEEAHEALSKLYQKTNKRGRLMRQPRRADSWQ